MSKHSVAVVLCAVIVPGVLLTEPAQAIPAFARREGAKCQMCHFRVPELNEDGRAYLRRGLREAPPGAMSGMEKAGEKKDAGKAGGMPGMEKPGEKKDAEKTEGMPGMEKPGEKKDAEKTEGTPEEPMKVPDAATPRPLGEPLALHWADYLTVMGHHMVTAQTGSSPAFDAGVLDTWAAGPIDRHWTALANASFDIQNGGASVDQAYGQFITRWTSRFQAARFGQVLPFAILSNQGGPSMTLSTPLVLSTPADTGTSWTPATLLRGLEIGAVDLRRWNIYAGAGQPHLDMHPGGAEAHTDIYASVEGLIGRNGSSLTLYGYRGQAWLSPDAPERPFQRIGVFCNLFWHKTKVVAGYLAGWDRDVQDQSLTGSGYFLLAEQLLSDRWAAYGRYDHLEQDLSVAGSRITRGPAIGVSWWAQTQIRLTVEGRQVETSSERTNKMLIAEFMWVL